ncbi:MAG: type II secretion system protein GspD [Flavobacteriales bacterium]|nr:MAG: type II secretion system protein GspD [Flavobacteriales bacterium]
MINLKPIFFIFILISSLNIFSQDSIILNYEDVDIKKVSQDIARFSKKTIILDPRVKGKITIYSNANLNSEQVWDVYLRTIQVNGFSTIEQDGFLRVVPENEATRDNTIDVSDGSFETAVIPLVNRSSEEILPMIKPITGRQSHLSSITSINSILLVDRVSNVSRVKNLLADLDKNNTAQISIIKLDNMSSIEAVRILDKLKTQNNPTINQFVAIPFTSSNSVILSANKLITQNVKSTLEALDKDAIADDSTDVIYLKFAKADELAAILNSISSTFISDTEGKKTIITHHEKTNSIIVSSAEENLKSIKNIIAKLDIRRAQVLVEAIVVDLSESAAKKLGVEAIYTGDDDSSIPIGVTRFSGTGPDLLAIAGASDDEQDVTLTTTAVSSLLNTQGLVAGFGDMESGENNFVGILNAIAGDTDSNILSTPSILAMDNEPARLFIGQEIPITTGESLGTNNSNPFRTTSRQEVGIELEITPQINEGSSVILNIKQGVSGVAGVAESGFDLITNKREIETTVLVDNNQIIVLGGLIDEDKQEVVSKVPVLGSIPLVGRLFQSSSTSSVKKNLMVFLKPKILIDSEAVNDISLEKYNYIKAQQELQNQNKNIIDLTNPSE